MADGAARFGQGSSGPALLRVPARLAAVPRTGLSPSTARPSRQVPLRPLLPSRRPYYPGAASTAPVWALPLSLAATRGVTVVFLSSDYLDVSVRRVGLPHDGMARLQRAGLPHSDTRGSRAARASPRIFAACRVLPRLREPRHPPCALVTLARPTRPSAASRRQDRVLCSSLVQVLFQTLVCFPSILSMSPRPAKAGCGGE